MPKREVYLFKDKNISIVPTPKVMQLKRAAEALFREYKYHKTTRVEFDRRLNDLYRIIGPWTRRSWSEL